MEIADAGQTSFVEVAKAHFEDELLNEPPRLRLLAVSSDANHVILRVDWAGVECQLPWPLRWLVERSELDDEIRPRGPSGGELELASLVSPLALPPETSDDHDVYRRTYACLYADYAIDALLRVGATADQIDAVNAAAGPTS